MNLQLQKKGFATAYATLGHIAYEHEKNTEKAVQYWLEGWKLRQDIDCAFNLGYLWFEGFYPNNSRNFVGIQNFFTLFGIYNFD